MFQVSIYDIENILSDYGVLSKPVSFAELQRYDYKQNDAKSKEVRLIIKVELSDGMPLVVRFKNEHDVTLELIDKQSEFAELLLKSGISTPMQYQSAGHFVRQYVINGYEVMVTVEEYVDGEIKCVELELAKKTGRLLARTHAIAQQNHFHVRNKVLFDAFDENDLFSVHAFSALEDQIQDEDKYLFQSIMEKYREYMKNLEPLKKEPRYAVQGDISNCNLYLTANGDVGLFDFNRCGDNSLYCDAVMQGVFEARLMDYPEEHTKADESVYLTAFLEGYQEIRPFTDVQKNMFPYLQAIISAFWSADIIWNNNSLKNEVKKGNHTAVRKWLEVIYERIKLSQDKVI